MRGTIEGHCGDVWREATERRQWGRKNGTRKTHTHTCRSLHIHIYSPPTIRNTNRAVLYGARTFERNPLSDKLARGLEVGPGAEVPPVS